jgi:hypothetical protein
MIGNSNITNEHVPQFAAVANDNMLGCATSGKYIHTTGPNVSPKQAMKNTNPKRIHIKEFVKNPIATIIVPTAVVKAPIYSRNFLPILVSKKDAKIAPTNCKEFIMIGMANFSDG